MRLALLLGSVNVGGNRLAMADLRDALVEAGFTRVETVVASGNVLLDAAQDPCEQIAGIMQARFGFAPCVVACDAARFDAIVAANPFPGADPARLHVHLTERAFYPADCDRLIADHVGRGTERIACGPLANGGGALYIDYCDGVGGSKLTAAFIEKRLRTRGTARNWRSLLRIRDTLLKTG